MNPENVARLDLCDSDSASKAREWRATDNQIGRAMRWTMKPLAGEMSNDNTIIADFKMKMAKILRGNEEKKELAV